jgi:hypothetical protein
MKTTIIRIPIILLLSLTNQVLCDGAQLRITGSYMIEMIIKVTPVYDGFLPVFFAVPFAVILTNHSVSWRSLIAFYERNKVVKLTKSPFLDL